MLRYYAEKALVLLMSTLHWGRSVRALPEPL